MPVRTDGQAGRHQTEAHGDRVERRPVAHCRAPRPVALSAPSSPPAPAAASARPSPNGLWSIVRSANSGSVAPANRSRTMKRWPRPRTVRNWGSYADPPRFARHRPSPMPTGHRIAGKPGPARPDGLGGEQRRSLRLGSPANSDREAGHAAFELLELGDRCGDHGESALSEERRSPRRVGGHDHGGGVEHDDRAPVSLRDGEKSWEQAHIVDQRLVADDRAIWQRGHPGFQVKHLRDRNLDHCPAARLEKVT